MNRSDRIDLMCRECLARIRALKRERKRTPWWNLYRHLTLTFDILEQRDIANALARLHVDAVFEEMTAKQRRRP